MNCLKIQTNEIKWYIYCRFLDATTNKQNNTNTEKNAVKDADEHLTTTEKVTHNQTVDEKEYTFVGLIVLVFLLMILLIGALIYIRKTGKICYKERGQKGKIIHHIISPLSLFSFSSDPLMVIKQIVGDYYRYIVLVLVCVSLSKI